MSLIARCWTNGAHRATPTGAVERLRRELGEAMDPVTRRANLMVSGAPLAEGRGRVLEVGSCRILVGGETRPCERMDEALEGLREALQPDSGGGVFGVVLQPWGTESDGRRPDPIRRTSDRGTPGRASLSLAGGPACHCRDLPEMPSPGCLAREGSAHSPRLLRGPGVLGTTPPRPRRSPSPPADRGPRSRRPRGEPHRPDVHRRPFRGLALPRAPPGWLCQPAFIRYPASTGSC